MTEKRTREANAATVAAGRARAASAPSSVAPPRTGEWLWTTREGAELDLVDELLLSNARSEPRVLGPALVVSRHAPSREGRVDATFARQGFPVSAVVHGASPSELRDRLARAIAPALGDRAYALHVWVPDTASANPLGQEARLLEDSLEAAFAEAHGAERRLDPRDLGPEAVPFVQVCLLARDRAAVGVMSSNRALSLAPGGRLRTRVPGDQPSRAARKLAEAFAWLGVAPEPSELCVDLGAAPGGWTWLLLERRARVVAVDPAKLRPDLLKRRGLSYVGMSAFEYTPDEPVDWLFCDMAWRPIEVARMLSRWGRNRLTTMLVANFKLPMKRKAETVAEIRSVLERGGFTAVRTRQLYHDRDEVTVTARVG
jgi:23S rRNA (cytidine2498-2'-O)-methyltransferase